MNCNEVKELFSPWLDGEMNDDERRLFQSHLAGCPACRRELDDWEKISLALREMSGHEISAPVHFSAAVMHRIQKDKETNGSRWYRDWKKTARSGVAAAVLLGLASVAITSGSVLQVADRNSGNEKAKNHYALPANQTPKVQTTNPAETSTGAPAASSADTGIKVADPQTDRAASPTAPEVKNNAAQAAPVFLNKERAISNTLLRIKAEDSSSVKEIASNMAKASGANIQTLGQYSQTSGECVILKITVAAEKANALLNQFAGLGSEINRQVEKQDLTSRFNSTLEQYQNLINQHSSIQDEEQLAQTDKQIKQLNEQLSSWDKEAGQETIVLWIEE